MAEDREIIEYIKTQSEVTIPALQLRFSADYRTILRLVRSLTEQGLLVEGEGISFAVRGGKGPLSGGSEKDRHSPELTVMFGSEGGTPVFGDIFKLHNILIGGVLQGERTTLLRSLLCRLIGCNSPDNLRILYLDPARQSPFYEGLPHLLTGEVIRDIPRAVRALQWAAQEMERRFTLFLTKIACGTYVRNFSEYNAASAQEERLEYILIAIDNYEMLAGNARAAQCLQSLAQKSCAAGVSLLVASGSTERIPMETRSNFSTRIAFRTLEKRDSLAILGEEGAELLERGDALIKTPDGSVRQIEIPDFGRSAAELIVQTAKEIYPADFSSPAIAYINRNED